LVTQIHIIRRLSFVTEQVALHTNGTIGALLNATFGNAPELLISIAALRSGYYRVVQLAMLGSMITNMMFVFGVSCLIGGLRWQVQSIRPVSGNVSVGMLLVATCGSLIPATLILSGQFQHRNNGAGGGILPVVVTSTTGASAVTYDVPTHEEVTLSRVNAAVMLILYLCYIVFQLGTHKDEFDDADDHAVHAGATARPAAAAPNVFCRRWCSRAVAHIPISHVGSGMSGIGGTTGAMRTMDVATAASPGIRGVKKRTSSRFTQDDLYEPLSQNCDFGMVGVLEVEEGYSSGPDSLDAWDDQTLHESDILPATSERRRRRKESSALGQNGSSFALSLSTTERLRLPAVNGVAYHARLDNESKHSDGCHETTPLISMRVGIVWLFLITLCVSAMSDILVDTIDGFAQRMKLSQVFTSMVIVPFFSNVAEQVTAFIFAYRNEMDLVVGVTIGSAIQIATFVLPGSVLIGMVMDRSMTLYFHSYETVCLLLCTLIVAAVLQGGTTNWMVGAMLIGIYTMFAAGIWFHEIENLNTSMDPIR
jgi:Ca2+/H+ antiporter